MMVGRREVACPRLCGHIIVGTDDKYLLTLFPVFSCRVNFGVGAERSPMITLTPTTVNDSNRHVLSLTNDELDHNVDGLA